MTGQNGKTESSLKNILALAIDKFGLEALRDILEKGIEEIDIRITPKLEDLVGVRFSQDLDRSSYMGHLTINDYWHDLGRDNVLVLHKKLAERLQNENFIIGSYELVNVVGYKIQQGGAT